MCSSHPTNPEPDPTAIRATYSLPVRLAASISTRHPFLGLFTSFLLPLVCLIIVISLETLSLAPLTLPDYFLRNDIRTRRDDARAAAHKLYDTSLFNSSEDHLPTVRSRPSIDLSFLLLFRTDGPSTNILTPSNIAAIKRAEDVFLSDSSLTSFCFYRFQPPCNDSSPKPPCALPDSVILSPHLYGVLSSSGMVCDRNSSTRPPSKPNISTFIRSLNTSHHYSSLLGRNAVNGSTWIAVTRFTIATPFELTSAQQDYSTFRSMAPFDEWILPLSQRVTKASLPEVHTYVYGMYLTRLRLTKTISRDIIFVLAAVAIVTILIAIHTGSLFLAVIAMLQVSLAFPLSLLIYFHVTRVPYFSIPHVFAVFLLLGIAADDVFVFSDAWKQADVFLGEVPVYDHMVWTYDRAVKAMTVTSLTTAIAFLVMVTSPIMPISTFGVWAAILIFVQFALVVTAYPCALVIWHKHLRECKLFASCGVAGWCGRRSQTASGGENDGDGVDNAHDADSVVDCDVAEDVLSFVDPDISSPAGSTAAGEATGALAANETSASWFVHCLPCLYRRRREKSKRNSSNTHDGDDGDGPKLRLLERWFNGPWINFVLRFRYVISLLGFAAIVTSIPLACLLQTIDGPEELFHHNHPNEVAERDIINEFDDSIVTQNLQVRFTWGIRDIDRNGTSYYKRDDIGKVVMDDDFDLKPAAAQQHMLSVCERLGNNASLVATDKPREQRVRCWIEDFLKWRYAMGLGDFVNYTNDYWLAYEVLSFARFELRETKEGPYAKYLTGKDILVSNDSMRVMGSEVRLLSPEPFLGSRENMQKVYDMWQKVGEEINARAPATARDVLVTAGSPWMFQRTQDTILWSMRRNIVILTAITAVTLSLTTGYLVTGLLATYALGGVVACLFGFVYLMKWRLGIAESLTAVLSVGYAFDGVAHIGTAFSGCTAESRVERTRGALTTLGISIVFGAASTAGSASMLLFAHISLLHKLGVLILVTMALAVVWSLMVLPAGLLLVGPNEKRSWIHDGLRGMWARIGGRCCVRRPSEEIDAKATAEVGFGDELRSPQSAVP